MPTEKMNLAAALTIAVLTAACGNVNPAGPAGVGTSTSEQRGEPVATEMTPAAVSQAGETGSREASIDTPRATALANVSGKIGFVSESPTDYTSYAPSTTFTSSWTLKNISTATIFVSSAQFVSQSGTSRLSSQNSVPIARLVSPGQSFTVSVSMRAPATGGTYREDWRLVDSVGNVYLVGSSSTFWRVITVPTTTVPGPASSASTIGQRIIATAERYLGYAKHPKMVNDGFGRVRSASCNCKEFVRAVVEEATSVSIPSTALQKYKWTTPLPARVKLIATSEGLAPALAVSTLRAQVQPGDVIQSYPISGVGPEHTAIVKTPGTDGTVLVEANYTPCTVTNNRPLNYANFVQTMRWSLYRVTN
jgi:hypothetical protein